MAYKYIKIPYDGTDMKKNVEAILKNNGISFACEHDYKWFTVDAGADTDCATEGQLRKLVKAQKTNAYVYYVDRKIREEHFQG